MASATRPWPKGFVRFACLSLILVPFALRCLIVNALFQRATLEPWSGWYRALCADGIYVASTCAIFVASLILERPRAVRTGLRLVFLVLIFLYCLDGAILQLFTTRLNPEDLHKYASYAPQWLFQTFRFKRLVLAAVPLLLVVPTLRLLSRDLGRPRGYELKSVAAFILLLAFLTVLGSPAPCIQSNLYENWIAYNLKSRHADRPYGKTYAYPAGNFPPGLEQADGREKPDTIILHVESLSAYFSKLFSGIHDFTPELDAIARGNHYFLNFYSNGFNTEDAMVAILKGLPPVYPPASSNFLGNQSFCGFHKREGSLPCRLGSIGYRSEFYCAGDLGFSQMDQWLQDIGFDAIESGRHPFYTGAPRFVFHSAPDGWLFRRVLQRLAQPRDRPLFIYIATLSTHHPFHDPESGQSSKERCVRYTDRQIGYFYHQLMAMHFFDHGQLFITADHRDMSPLGREEIARFGPRAPFAIPLIVCTGTRAAEPVLAPFQQADIYATILAHLCKPGAFPFSPFQGDLLASPDGAPKLILARRGDRRDLLAVFHANRARTVALDGDATRFQETGQPPDALDSLTLLRINSLRTREN